LLSTYTNLQLFSLILYSLTGSIVLYSFFFFTDTPTTEIYTLSLHDALPISPRWLQRVAPPSGSCRRWPWRCRSPAARRSPADRRSEEHTSELQSLRHLVCRLLLEKKKKYICSG